MVDLLKKYWPVHLIVLVHFLVTAKFFGHIPVWDGATYTINGIYEAIRAEEFNIFNFDALGHPMILLHLLFAVPWFFDLGNYYLLHITVGILYIMAIYSFYGIVSRIFNDSKFKTDLILLTIIFAFYPIHNATLLNLTTGDIGILIFFPIFLFFFLSENILPATLAATMLVFSKETGFLIYLCILLTDFFLSQLKKRGAKSFVILIKSKFLLLFPLIFYISTLIIKFSVFHDNPLYVDAFNQLKMKTDWPDWQIEKVFPAYLSGIFIVNYNWILTVLAVIGTGKHMFNKIAGKGIPETGINIKHISFLYILIIPLFFILTFYKTFVNLRYFIPIYFVMMILSFFSLTKIFNKSFVRRIFLLLITAVFLYTNFRTTDPVSKKIYGTFKFGKHDLLKMTSITDECCGFGRDQIMYNLEYLKITEILDEIISDLRLKPDTAIAYQPLVGLWGIDRIDKNTYKRTYSGENSFKPLIVNWKWDRLEEKPGYIYFIEFPITESEPALVNYLNYYDIVSVKSYSKDGYSMKVLTMKKTK